MITLFTKTLNMSIVGTMSIFIVIVARHFLKNKPKIFSYFLWLPVFFRFIFPFSFYSTYSIIGSINKNTEYISFPQATKIGEQTLNTVSNVSSFKYITNPANTQNISQSQSLFNILTIIWLFGLLFMLIYSFASLVLTYKKVGDATLVNKNIYETDKIRSPFVLGLIPKIFIPTGIEKNDFSYIIEHENTHIKRGDHLIKPLAYTILAIHWFNPFIWVAFSIMTKDMEMSCDESVIKNLNNQEAKNYSYALLNVSVNNSGLLRPIGFGESNVKARVKNILKYKKSKLASICFAVVCCIIFAFFILANPHIAKSNGKELGNTLSHYNHEELILNDVIDFDYDYVIQFPSYANKKTMNELIGFNCPFLIESVSEGMMNILFVKNNKPICYIFGYGENNGFRLCIPEGEKLPKQEIGIYSVTFDNGYPLYTSSTEVSDNSLYFKPYELMDTKNPYITDALANGGQTTYFTIEQVEKNLRHNIRQAKINIDDLKLFLKYLKDIYNVLKLNLLS